MKFLLANFENFVGGKFQNFVFGPKFSFFTLKTMVVNFFGNSNFSDFLAINEINHRGVKLEFILDVFSSDAY